MKKGLTSIVRIAISFGLLALLFWLMRREARDIWGTLAACRIEFLFIAAGILLVNVLMLAYRLKIIFLGENLKISLKDAHQLTYIGYFFNNFMPTAVGGDIVKAHYASLANKEKMRSYASVFMDRIIGLYTFLVVAAIALLVDRGKFQLEAVRSMVFIFLALGALGFIIVTNEAVARFVKKFFMRIKMMRLGEKLYEAYDIVRDYRNRLGVVTEAFFISIIAQGLYFIVVHMLFLALGKDVGLGNIFLIMPVVTFISMVPSVGGLGVREGAMVLFFTPLAGKEMSFAMSLLFLGGLMFISLIGGCIYLWWGVRTVKEEKKGEI